MNIFLYLIIGYAVGCIVQAAAIYISSYRRSVVGYIYIDKVDSGLDTPIYDVKMNQSDMKKIHSKKYVVLKIQKTERPEGYDE